MPGDLLCDWREGFEQRKQAVDQTVRGYLLPLAEKDTLKKISTVHTHRLYRHRRTVKKKWTNWVPDWVNCRQINIGCGFVICTHISRQLEFESSAPYLGGLLWSLSLQDCRSFQLPHNARPRHPACHSHVPLATVPPPFPRQPHCAVTIPPSVTPWTWTRLVCFSLKHHSSTDLQKKNVLNGGYMHAITRSSD